VDRRQRRDAAGDRVAYGQPDSLGPEVYSEEPGHVAAGAALGSGAIVGSAAGAAEVEAAELGFRLGPIAGVGDGAGAGGTMMMLILAV
jgi:hypothetical protein